MLYDEFIEKLKKENSHYVKCFEEITDIQSATICGGHVILWLDAPELKKVELNLSFNEPKIFFQCANTGGLTATKETVQACIEHKKNFYKNARSLTDTYGI